MKENKIIDETQLRVSFENSRSESGFKRDTMLISLSKRAKSMISEIVSTGSGRYGSSFIEVSIRLLYCIITGNDVEYVLKEFKKFIIDKNSFKNNIRKLAEEVDKVF